MKKIVNSPFVVYVYVYPLYIKKMFILPTLGKASEELIHWVAVKQLAITSTCFQRYRDN